MIRVLLMIAVAGFVLSVGTLSAAVAIGGPEALAHGGWNLAGRHWDSDRWHDDYDGDDGDGPVASGPTTTRTLDWSGDDRLDIDLPADVRYVQTAGAGSVEVTGPERLVNRVIVRDDSIRYRSGRHRHYRRHPKLTIVVRAPDVSSFDISGRSTLAIEGFRQARLNLDVSGDAEVTGVGEADEVRLDVSGSGDVDLGQLRSKGASVDISGAADARLAPTEWARLEISGAGDVSLVTRPPRLETDISGAGRVRQGEDATPSPSPSPPPTPPPSPSPKGAKL